HDHDECNRLVNEQAQISLLLAGPGVVATLTCAPPVIALFYHKTFAGAVDPLRWIFLWIGLCVIPLPLGFILRGEGARSRHGWCRRHDRQRRVFAADVMPPRTTRRRAARRP